MLVEEWLMARTSTIEGWRWRATTLSDVYASHDQGVADGCERDFI